ncbi:GTP-binding protein EngA [Buchnera aphidicola str. Ak (Acyrthosiphon kondoi)]|uniref:GTPase Der n=1 Tax=Buchnera aphidicola str. Ak (Acyrthosiphon kondoi) TaxID=1005090 RepID=G2LM84_9GAMM|nr:ribosome biogenesis GTPase Der [Buchnera aphidicola]AEO08931.1 GTP-binding protein EngA [Buchnera aphidicola str. Ak (Acyrthosiphon kondoi)]WAI18270.1 MAG: ribosome biogenesis GTPase Der [Buchnera aphidicola (Acyrthosiphon caraganae)]
MIPIIVLIGRTNVGKSTLFNILTKTRDALVINYPGITRDRQYGYCKLQLNQKVMLIDTAGLDMKLNEIQKKAHEQTLIAIKESHLILFVVDAHDGLMAQEYEIAQNIRTHHKKTILIINKIDGVNHASKINEFYSLGFEKIQKISASHNQGIDTLIKKHLIPWTNMTFKKEIINQNIKSKKSPIKVAFIGRPNVGKSTLINGILKEERMITCNIPGTTLDSISTSMKYNCKDYTLVDTAGASKKKKENNKIEKFSIIKTLQTIEKSNVILLILDASLQICHQDLSLADFIINSGKGIVVVMNKCDLLNSLEFKEVKESIKKQLKFLYFSRIHFISALYKKGIFQLFKSIHESYSESKRKISTSMLTRTMHIAIKKHQPPIIKGRRIKLKYAHLGSLNPPKIIIHGNQVKYLSLPYKRYLINFFYNALKIKGTPIQIQFKDNVNPYITNKN